jgi:hypothetical protein
MVITLEKVFIIYLMIYFFWWISNHVFFSKNGIFKSKNRYIFDKGRFGEKYIAKLLTKLNNSQFEVINDFQIYRTKKECQIDHIIISSNAIYSIEVKNYSGEITGHEFSRYWSINYKRRNYPVYSPVFQNAMHVKHLKMILKLNIPIYSVVVFMDQICFRKLITVNTPVIRANMLLRYINNFDSRIKPHGFNISQIKSSILNFKSHDMVKLINVNLTP